MGFVAEAFGDLTYSIKINKIIEINLTDCLKETCLLSYTKEYLS